MPPPEQDHWFYEIVLPHEPALRAYLLKRFPALPDHDDVIQEAYLRMLRMRNHVRDDCAKAYLLPIGNWIFKGIGSGRGFQPGSNGAGVVSALGVGVDAAWLGREVMINPSFDWGASEAGKAARLRFLGCRGRARWRSRSRCRRCSSRPNRGI